VKPGLEIGIIRRRKAPIPGHESGYQQFTTDVKYGALDDLRKYSTKVDLSGCRLDHLGFPLRLSTGEISFRRRLGDFQGNDPVLENPSGN